MNIKLPVFILAALAAFIPLSHGDDTDIYFGGATGSGTEPMLMLILDYRSNLGATLCTAGSDCDSELGTDITDHFFQNDGTTITYFDAMRAVLASVISDLEGIKIGLMMSHDDNCNGNGGVSSYSKCSNGAYILNGFQSMLPGDSNNAKANLIAKMNALPVPHGNLSHSFQGKEVFFELYRYLSGQAIHSAHLGFKDFGDKNKNTNLDVDFPAFSWDTSIESGNNYISPLGTAGSCTEVHAVTILHQVSNHDSDSDSDIQASVANGGMGLSGNSTIEEVLAWLQQSDLASGVDGFQNLTSHFISKNVNTTTNGYASAGGSSQAIGWDLSGPGMQRLKENLQDLIRIIISESSTFVSASVPVNVFNRAEINDSLFIALFEVEENGLPSWSGNLKKLRIKQSLINGQNLISLVDANDNEAVAADGRIRYDALTYWTKGNHLPPVDANATGEEANRTAGRDGRFVELGAAGQLIPGYINADGTRGTVTETNGNSGRTVYLQNTIGQNPLDFNANSGMASSLMTELGASTSDEALEIIKWARGNDPVTGQARDWILADALHSRPTPVNYGALGSHTKSNPDIRVLMGTNDGLMHMFRNTNVDGTQSGVESWAFMPRSALPILKVLKENTSSTPPHPYGSDGELTLYTHDANNDGTLDHNAGDKVYAFFGMRRGGQHIYALDISNPDQPQQLWHIDGGSGDFSELAMSFSTPRPITVQYGGTATKALIFGGGYNGGWNSGGTRVGKDASNAADTPDQGNAIFIVNLETGALIWKAAYHSIESASDTVYHHPELIDSIASEVAVLDSNGDGIEDRAYVGDTGGSVWRIDFPAGTGSDNRATQWQIVKLADLDQQTETVASDDDDGSSTQVVDVDRRFFHRPDIVQTGYGASRFDAVILGSGNRAAPKGTQIDNWFYLIKDPNAQSRPDPANWTPITHDQLGDVSNDCTGLSCSANLSKGWRIGLSGTGEKALSSPLTIQGQIYFTTYLPDGTAASGSCAPTPGSGRVYSVSLNDGSPTKNRNVTDDNGNRTPSTPGDRYSELKAAGIPSEVVALTPNDLLLPDLSIEQVDADRIWRTFWYQDRVEEE